MLVNGTFMCSTLLDMDSRLRVARAIEKDETQASISVFRILQRRGRAMVEVYGVVPEYGGRGRPPTHKKLGTDWLYLQMVKQQDERGRFEGVRLRAIFSKKAEVIELLGESTAYIERSNLTSRLFNSRHVRKTLAYSKHIQAYRAAATWEDSYYNLVRPHKRLRLAVQDDPSRMWSPQTPAMTAGLTDHIWAVKEQLTNLPLPNVTHTC